LHTDATPGEHFIGREAPLHPPRATIAATSQRMFLGIEYPRFRTALQ
jgi:hypothetical protein